MNRLLAVDIGNTPLGTGTIQSKYPDLASIVNRIIPNALTLAGILLLILLIAGGFMLIIGAGNNDPKKAQMAQAMVTDALIGFAVVFLSYLLIQLIQVITGLQIL